MSKSVRLREMKERERKVWCNLNKRQSMDLWTYSKTLLSFWSPQMRISEMDRTVSTRRLRFCSVTCWFLHSKLCRYLWIKKVKDELIKPKQPSITWFHKYMKQPNQNYTCKQNSFSLSLWHTRMHTHIHTHTLIYMAYACRLCFLQKSIKMCTYIYIICILLSLCLLLKGS